MSAIIINGLSKKYSDITAVDNLSLCIEEGELFSLLGVNGAGKTTTIKMLSCISEPTDGDAYLLGNSIRKNSAEAKKLISVSPHVDKKSMEQFEIRTHKRVMDIVNPSAKTVDELKKLNLPAGVDISIKIGI